MKGMRKRVTIAFSSIVCLLFLSGLLSLVELNRVSHGAGDILTASRRNVELAKEMLDAAHAQNVALIHLTVLGDEQYVEATRRAMGDLEQVLMVARDEALDPSFLDSLSFATIEMKVMVDRYLNRLSEQKHQPAIAADTASVELPIDSLGVDSLLMRAAVEAAEKNDEEDSVRWYTEEYEAVYLRLTAAVKAYMTSTQSSLAPRTEQMKKSAYRAVTPVLISLLVMIAVLVMFYYFMLIYCVNPIVRMNRSLGHYLSFKVPFTVKEECKDELLELKEKIESLINQLRYK
jgi:CHASE3 domain sensor protein